MKSVWKYVDAAITLCLSGLLFGFIAAIFVQTLVWGWDGAEHLIEWIVGE